MMIGIVKVGIVKVGILPEACTVSASCGRKS